ncbi:MAG: metallophosphoesterase family protein [Patescibacteria group bacterium]
MKIAIISDTHDNLPNFKKAVDWIKSQKIKLIIHCGDIFKPDTVKEILKTFKGRAYFIFSPADASFSGIPEKAFDNLKNVKVYSVFGEIKIPASPARLGSESERAGGGANPVAGQAHYGARKIAFCHFPEIAKELAKTQKYDFVFYGHTHKPWLKKIGKTKLVNPGNLANIFYKPTFAVYDTKTDKLELKILERL